jgi:hypothetical protein
MNISTRLSVSAASAAATLTLAVGTFGMAAPASADPALDPTPTTTATAAPTPTSTGAPAPTPTLTTSPTTPKPKAVKKSKKGPKAKVLNYKRLTSRAKRVANKVRNDWRRIKVIGGWRAGSRYSSDHPAGRAVDVMIPSWKKNASLGYSIARYFTRHAKHYKIHYVIFRKKIWTVQNPHWRTMANRGGATANHFDHVHISVKR